MKIFLSFLFVFYLVLRPLVPLLDFAANYDFISKNICENRDQPEVLCNGKCYLVKEIQRFSDNQIHDSAKTQFSLESFVVDRIIYCAESFIESEKQLQSASLSQNLYHYLFFQEVFHPPLTRL